MSDVYRRNWDRYTWLVYGYVGEFAELERVAIPAEICGIINEFYSKMDEWDKQQIHFIDIDTTHFDDDTNIVKIENRETRWQNIYGKYRIKPKNYISFFKNKKNQKHDDQKYEVIQSWKIRVIQNMIIPIINVGIVIASQIEAIEKDEDNIHAFDYSNGGYGVQLFFKIKHGPKTQKYNSMNRGKMKLTFKKDDAIEITLLFKDSDYGNCCIGFRKNGSDIELAFDDLDINESYAVAVATYHPEVTIQMLE